MSLYDELNAHHTAEHSGDKLLIGRGADHATDLGQHPEGAPADTSSDPKPENRHKSAMATRAYDNRKTTMSTPVNISARGQVLGGMTAYYGASFLSTVDAVVTITSQGFTGPVVDLFAMTANVPVRSSYSEGIVSNGLYISASVEAATFVGSVHVGTME